MNKILSFATAQMNLKGTMLSEVGQTEEDRYHMLLLMCEITPLPRKRLIEAETKGMASRGVGGEGLGKW